jgi:hypothetical protein
MTMWEYRVELGTLDRDLVGYDVEAVDGKIGKIDEASNEAGSAYLVVDTGFWIFGKKRVLPAGVIDRIDPNDRQIYVNLTKDQVRQAPDFEKGLERDEKYRKDVGNYYSPYFRS